jgi:protein-tyrosine phosphatase
MEARMNTEVYWIDAAVPGRLALLARPRGADWLDDEVRSLRRSGVDVLVSLLAPDEMRELELDSEAGCCAAAGIGFISFPIQDRSVPASPQATVEVVTRIAALLRQGKSVAIHCRQGVGRAGLMSACVLAWLGQEPGAALERISAARGCAVPETDEQREWLRDFTKRHAGR